MWRSRFSNLFIFADSLATNVFREMRRVIVVLLTRSARSRHARRWMLAMVEKKRTVLASA